MKVSSLHYLCHMKKLKYMKQKINQSGVILGVNPYLQNSPFKPPG